jgi:hypothetical protein
VADHHQRAEAQEGEAHQRREQSAE